MKMFYKMVNYPLENSEYLELNAIKVRAIDGTVYTRHRLPEPLFI